MLPTYVPPVFVDDSPSGPYLDDDYFNGVGGRIRDIINEVNLIQTDKLYHTFKNKPNGAITSTSKADSGQTFIPVGPTIPTVNTGVVGFPLGFNNNGAQTASYLMVELGSAVTRLKGKVRFDAADGNANTSNATIGIFNKSTIDNSTTSTCHLSITPTYMEMSLGSNSSDFAAVAPQGHPLTGITFPYPLKTDGVTEYEVDIVLDKVNGRMYARLGNLPVYEWRDERIKQDNRFVFWETFVNQTTTGYAGFSEIYADDRVPTFDQLNAFRGGVGRRPGSSLVHRRPSSRLHAGVTWWDATNSLLTYSDGIDWRDFSGARKGNLFSDNDINPYSVNPWNTDNAVKKVAKSHAKSRFPTCLEFTANGGLINVYKIVDNNLPTINGQTYSFLVGETLTKSASPRDAFLTTRYYDASYNILLEQQSAAFTMPTDAPKQSVVQSHIAPAGTAALFYMLTIPSAQTGDIFQLSGFCLTPGTVQGFVER